MIFALAGGGGKWDKCLADWDFTKSLTDSVNGLTATLGGNASRESAGVSIPDMSSYVTFPIETKAVCRRYEIDLGAMSYFGSAGVNHRLFMFSAGGGIVYRTSGYWSFYNKAASGRWATDSTIADFDYFANSTIKISIDKDMYFHMYKGDTLVYEPSIPAASLTDFYGVADFGFSIGQSSNSCATCVIAGFRVYEEL